MWLEFEFELKFGWGLQVRYTSVRRQTTPKPGEPELQVLDYQNVANDLLPLVSSAYALIFMVRPPYLLFCPHLQCLTLYSVSLFAVTLSPPCRFPTYIAPVHSAEFVALRQ